jgi:hypothetical protein
VRGVVVTRAPTHARRAGDLDFEDQESFLSLDYSGATHGFSANAALLALQNDGLADTPTGNHSPAAQAVTYP